MKYCGVKVEDGTVLVPASVQYVITKTLGLTEADHPRILLMEVKN